MSSLFVTGIDTDIGKTVITAGLALSLQRMGIDIGVMKPFAAAARPQKTGFKSKDVQIICNAAQVNDSEDLVNPQFFPMPASPYTAWKTLKIKPKIPLILERYKKLNKLHKMILVEGIGGIMTPILADYYVANLIRDLCLPAIIVTTTRVGSFNHTVMSVKMCEKYNIPIKGVIVNDIDSGPYNVNEVKRDLKNLLGVTVLGVIPFMDYYDELYDSDDDKKYDKDDKTNQSSNTNKNSDLMYHIFKKNINFKLLT